MVVKDYVREQLDKNRKVYVVSPHKNALQVLQDEMRYRGPRLVWLHNADHLRGLSDAVILFYADDYVDAPKFRQIREEVNMRMSRFPKFEVVYYPEPRRQWV